MVNTRSKGRKAEKEWTQVLIQEKGFKPELIEIVKGSSKFNKQVDIFGEFDILAIKDGVLHLYQVKCNRTAGSLKKLREWYKNNRHDLPKDTIIEVVVRYDNKRGSDKWKQKKI